LPSQVNFLSARAREQRELLRVEKKQSMLEVPEPPPLGFQRPLNRPRRDSDAIDEEDYESPLLERKGPTFGSVNERIKRSVQNCRRPVKTITIVMVLTGRRHREINPILPPRSF
jgi:hypothetical protein